MVLPVNNQKVEGRKLYTVMTAHVAETLELPEVMEAFEKLMEKMKTPDPDNPNLWTIEVAGRKLWGILDERAGPNGEDLLTLLFPEDY